jgi:cytochrome b561
MRKVRAVVVLTLLTTGLFQAVSGLILYTAPKGREAGDITLYGFEKHLWKEYHFYIGILIICLVVLHLILNWKMFKNELKSLIGK